MQFHEFLTTYAFTKKLRPDMDLSLKQFYGGMNQLLTERAITGAEEARCENNRVVAEWDWYDNGCPYFKIYPAVVPMLSAVHIDIPSEYLKLPFSTFCVRLAGEDLAFAPGRYIKSFLMTEAIIDGSRRVYLWTDTNEYENGCPVITYNQLVCDPGISIEDSIGILPRREMDMPDEFNRSLVKLAVSICFLATGSDRLLSPDVLSKDLAAWLEASRRGDAERLRVIEQRAARRGKLGWNVGARELVHARHPAGEPGNGHELSYQHQRRAHFRLLKDRVTFIRQATVRPDLPPRSV